jgi:hypothetical protein
MKINPISELQNNPEKIAVSVLLTYRESLRTHVQDRKIEFEERKIATKLFYGLDERMLFGNVIDNIATTLHDNLED